MQICFAPVAIVTALCLTSWAAAADPTGMWRSTVALNGQAVETLVSLYLDSEGPTLTGFVLDSASNQKLPIFNARYRGNQLQFSVCHDSPAQKLSIHYDGDISGGVIVGSASFDSGDRNQTASWTAKRERVAGR